jgi:hypothetical protein
MVFEQHHLGQKAFTSSIVYDMWTMHHEIKMKYVRFVEMYYGMPVLDCYLETSGYKIAVPSYPHDNPIPRNRCAFRPCIKSPNVHPFLAYQTISNLKYMVVHGKW